MNIDLLTEHEPNFDSHGQTADREGAGWTDGLRVWQDETTGPIQSWEDFEKYPWPKPEDTDYSGLEYLSLVVPEGMKICANQLGILDNTTWLMGFQAFYYALYDQPDLVQAILDKVAELSVKAAQHIVTIDNVEMLLIVDEMGYNKGTVLKPEMLRKYVYPQHRRLVDIAHEAGKLFILHSCGNLTAVMDEVIEAEQFDGKHSRTRSCPSKRCTGAGAIARACLAA
jgi:uroporphyrinogen decarboxylase